MLFYIIPLNCIVFSFLKVNVKNEQKPKKTKSSYFEGPAHSKIYFEPFLGSKAPRCAYVLFYIFILPRLVRVTKFSAIFPLKLQWLAVYILFHFIDFYFQQTVIYDSQKCTLQILFAGLNAVIWFYFIDTKQSKIFT